MKTKTGLVLLGVLALAGCVPVSPPPPAPAPHLKAHPDERVVIAPAAKGLIRLLDLHTGTSLDGVLMVQVDVLKVGQGAQTFLYQTDWLDQDGKSLDMTSEPLPWTLLANETASMTLTAPTPLAKSFLLTFSLKPRR